MVIIFTGPIGTGKTTRLEEWVKTRKNIAGILMPLRDGKRFFYSIAPGELKPAEVDPDKYNGNIIKIRKYSFSGENFEWANREILKAFTNYNTLVIDEIGPLEMSDKGFSTSLSKILSNNNDLNNINLIFVVRQGMVEEVTEYFGIDDFNVISGPDEIEVLLNKS